MEPIDISTVSKGLISLLILCSTALIISAAMDMASTPFCGSAAWAFLPVTRISKKVHLFVVYLCVYHRLQKYSVHQ